MGSETHPASYLMGTGEGGGASSGFKCPGREANRLPPYSDEFKILWVCKSTPQFSFVACKGKYTIYLYQ
jgi:hypothetical protein